jgi:DNA polymerase
VAPDGAADTGLVWLTGPPDAEADRSGRPASGPDGVLLDRMLASIGLTRPGVLVVPVVPWRPPGGRPPSAAELSACLPFLLRLLALARPHTLVLEAGLPVQALGLRGRRDAGKLASVTLPDLPAPVAALTLPSFSGIRQSAERRREAWDRLRHLRRRLDAVFPKN